MQTYKLKNDIDVLYKQNVNTPRVALCFNIGVKKAPVKPAVISLMTRLFMQGTKNRSAEVLSEELDKFAIEFSVEYKLDYLKFKFVCLNEDFEKALEIFDDVINNTTFEDLEKEKVKLAGEIEADLDSPNAKVFDNYYKNIYENHIYGYTNTVIYENINEVTKDDIINSYNEIMSNSNKVIAFVGDLDSEFVRQKLDEIFSKLPKSMDNSSEIVLPKLIEAKKVEIVQSDINQAHIIQGWHVPPASSEDYPVLALLNVILGSSGLSSRLFLELRDKKGLAYVVRSSYDILKLCANFFIYIATEPKNIDISLEGFKIELDKIKKELVSAEELNNARNNLLGKWAFLQENNSQQASVYAHYAIIGLGFDFNSKAKEMLKTVTPEQIRNCANKYFNDLSVISVIKP